jgi:hypothetical protein
VAETLLRLAGGLALGWVALVALLALFQRTFLYPFAPFDARADLPRDMRLAEIARPDGGAALAWVAEGDPSLPAVLYFTGNGGYLPGDLPRIRAYAEAGHPVVAAVYPGAGGNAGRPTETAMVADALALHDALPGLVETQAAVVHGWSMGGAVALALAARRPVGAVVIEASFARLCDVAAERLPFVPACLLLLDRWESADRLPRLDAPMLLLHGTGDGVVPVPHGEALRDAARTAGVAVDWRVVPGAGHDIGAARMASEALPWLAERLDPDRPRGSQRPR